MKKERKSKKFQFNLSPREKELYERAAIKLNCDNLSSYIRLILTKESISILGCDKCTK